MNMNIPNGSRVNFFGSGGVNGGFRLEIAKQAIQRPVTITQEDVDRFMLNEQLDPGRIYSARRADHQADKTMTHNNVMPSAESIYAARRLDYDR